MQRDQLRRLAETLNRHRVEYLVIGGLAARLHGGRRPTRDLDLLTGQGDANLTRLAEALNELGARYRDQPLRDIHLRGGNSRWTTTVGVVDVLWDATGTTDRVAYADVDTNRVVAVLDDVEIPVIGLADLAELKAGTGRAKDLADLAELHRRHPDIVPAPEQRPNPTWAPPPNRPTGYGHER